MTLTAKGSAIWCFSFLMLAQVLLQQYQLVGDVSEIAWHARIA
jgi:hypothetical protein